MNLLKVAFWAKDSGNLMSHTKGLTKEQIEEIKKLKEGDRLILWHNKREKETDASYTLKVFSKDVI